jgi:mycofactocin precursor
MMSGQVATAQAVAEAGQEPGVTDAATVGREATAEAPAAQPEVTIQDMLVEDVSIDGMCGVY